MLKSHCNKINTPIVTDKHTHRKKIHMLSQKISDHILSQKISDHAFQKTSYGKPAETNITDYCYRLYMCVCFFFSLLINFLCTNRAFKIKIPTSRH